MATAKPPQASGHVSQVMIFDVQCRSIQSIRGARSEAVDCLGTLASSCANRGGSRMKRVPGLITRLIQSPAGGPA
jgi:hypothetical protein